MQESAIVCRYCKNQAYFDSKSSTSFCKSQRCQGAVIEFGKITYENEVNLYEVDEPGKKQTRFGGYENKREAFKNQLCEMLGKKDSKQRKQFCEKFEAGEHLIQKFSSIFRMNEALTKDAISKYRSLIFDNAQAVASKSFQALAVVAYNLTIQVRQSQQNSNQKLNKINLNVMLKFCDISQQQLEQITKALDIKNFAGSGRQHIYQEILQTIKDHRLPFNEYEVMGAFDIPYNLMENNVIKGERQSTITCVVEYLLAQLSCNPDLNNKTLDYFAQLNEVSRDTAKRLWNIIIDNQLLPSLISYWQGQRPISVLHHIY
ncbi:unnamed protein product [Paramecium sonneborni]|uniref:Uncharacterized protein n=1 Tax=Paramecium sonneborni TaxID=65129 RepID=A0A8S1KPK1_9CILI|nr:unnamed protein product [Paramecium sonneborni]